VKQLLEETMNTIDKNTEKGQAIVYLVLGLVVFLGFVALAIDGGMVLSDRRHAQNAADAASLAGGAAAAFHLKELSNQTCQYAWSCGNSVVLDALGIAEDIAQERADDNNFTIDFDLADHHGVDAQCSADPDYISVIVDVSSTTQSNFLQLVSVDALQNQVEAVTRISPGGPVAFGNAIVALNDELCIDPGSQGVIIGGSGTVYVAGGDIFSNGCLRQNGSAMTVTVEAPYNALGHELIHIDPDNWVPIQPEETSDLVNPSDYQIDPPDCNDAPADQRNVSGHSVPSTLDEGLWCITGDLMINQSETFENLGGGVTLMMLDGKLIINGPADVHVNAYPSDYEGNTFGAIPGVLIYLPETNSNVVTLNGNQDSVISGLIYAPNSLVTLTGTGGNTYNPSQVIGLDVEITGDADLHLTYDGCMGYLRPPKIELYK
jgi:Putative Flp pilus-assembly TadE/G-like